MYGKRSDLIRLLRPYAVGFAASGASLGLAAIAQLVTFALLARALGAAEFGQVVAISAVIAIAAPFCGLGSLEGVVRRTASRPADFQAMLGHALTLIIVTGGVMVALGTAALPALFPLSANPVTAVAATAMMLTGGIVLGNIVNLAEHAFLAHVRFGNANLVVTGFAIARTATAALAVLGFGVTTAAGWAAWFLACHLVSAAGALAAIATLGRPHFGFVADELPRGAWFSLPILARAVRQNADLLVLGLVAQSHVLASYGIARRILDTSYLSIGALSRLVYPGSAIAALRGPEALLARARTILVASVLVGGIAAAVIWLTAPWLPLVFGADYDTLPGFARNLCWLVVIAAAGTAALDVLAASARHARRAAVLGAGSILGAALIAAATAFYGPEGAIVAAYAADAAVAIMAWVMLVRLSRPAAGVLPPLPGLSTP